MNNNLSYRSLKDAMIKDAAKKGYELISQDAEYNGDKQGEQVQNLIAHGVDAIVIITSSALIERLVERTSSTGIPVFIVDSGDGSDFGVVSYINTDYSRSGEQAAEYVAQKVLEGGAGQVAVITNTNDDGTVNKTEKGFINWMAANAPKVEVVDVQSYKVDRGNYTVSNRQAADIMQNMLLKHKELDLVFCVSDAAAKNALAAINAAKSPVKVMSLFANYEGVEAILSGSNWIANVAEDPDLTSKSILDTIQKHLAGKPVDKRILVSPRVIDASNLK
jgi:ribose transport system substrate-binding protein